MIRVVKEEYNSCVNSSNAPIGMCTNKHVELNGIELHRHIGT